MMISMKTTYHDEIQERDGSVHLLLCGHSTDHLIRVIDAYHPAHLDFFTSAELRPYLESFLETLRVFTGTFHIEDIPSFTENSIRMGTNTIMARYRFLKNLFPSSLFYFGITGGTNTMAVEMALAALTAGDEMHYVIYGTEHEQKKDKIITFNTLELRNIIMKSNIHEGEIHDKF